MRKENVVTHSLLYSSIVYLFEVILQPNYVLGFELIRIDGLDQS